MPQLDFTTYSSQIFWFLICFSLLYICASKIILPRIKEIIANRANIIGNYDFTAKSLQGQIEDLDSKTQTLRVEASKSYKSKLSQVIKEAATNRDKMIENLKAEIDQNNQKSRQEIKDFIEQSTSKSEAEAQKLAQLIKEKLFAEGNFQKVN